MTVRPCQRLVCYLTCPGTYFWVLFPADGLDLWYRPRYKPADLSRASSEMHMPTKTMLPGMARSRST